MLTEKAIKEVIAECDRFKKRAQAVLERAKHDEYFNRYAWNGFAGFRETAALKRASLDLTIILADLRRR